MTSYPRMARRAVPALALLGVAALVTGCGPDASTGSATPSAPVASASTTSAGGTSSGGTGGTTGGGSTTTAPSTTSSGSSSAVSRCATRDLQASTGASQGTAGSSFVVIDFKNISGATCTLYGYPGVSQAGGKPVDQIGAAADRYSIAPATRVTLAPGAVANALLRITDAGNFDASKCVPTPAQYLQVFPPNQTTPIYVAHTSTACADSVTILAVTVVRSGIGTAS